MAVKLAMAMEEVVRALSRRKKSMFADGSKLGQLYGSHCRQ